MTEYFGWEVASKYLKEGKKVYLDHKEIYMLPNGKLRYFDARKIKLMVFHANFYINKNEKYGINFILNKKNLFRKDFFIPQYKYVTSFKDILK